MKTGLCVNMFQNNADCTGFGVFEYATKAGFDYFEAPAAQLLALPNQDLDREIAHVRSSGLSCLAMNNLFQAQIRLTGAHIDKTLIDDYIDRAIDLGRRLGAGIFVFGSAGARNVPMGFPREKAWEQLVGMLQRFGAKAGKAGVTVVVEHINRLESNIVNTFAEGIRLVRDVDLDSVQGFVDYFHLGLGNETLEAVEENFGMIRHCHFANLLNRTLPIPTRHEEGVNDFLALLRRLDYRYGVSVEGYSSLPETEIAEARAYLK